MMLGDFGADVIKSVERPGWAMTPAPGAAVRRARRRNVFSTRSTATSDRSPWTWPRRRGIERARELIGPPTSSWRTSALAPWAPGPGLRRSAADPTGPDLLLHHRFRPGWGSGAAGLRPAGPGRRRSDERHQRHSRQPTKVGVALVDVLTGLHALSGMLAALHHQDRTGEGASGSRPTCCPRCCRRW